MCTIPEPWPHPDILQELVSKSSGYFIYAATVIKFVDDRDFRPTERLEALRLPKPESASPFADLDQMYHQILSTVPVSIHPRLLRLLCAMMEWRASPIELENLLRLDSGDVQLTCRRLGSLLQTTPELAMHHSSFYDFLQDPIRSGKFHVSLQHWKDLACSLLMVISGSIGRDYYSDSNFAWSVIEWVFSKISPSDAGNLAPLFRNVNPDFFWCSNDPKGKMKQIIHWLKETNPIHRDVVQIWEDYEFLRSCDSIIANACRDEHGSGEGPSDVNELRNVISAPLLAIFRTYWLAGEALGLCTHRATNPSHVLFMQFVPFKSTNFYHVRSLLGMSWEDIRLVARVLRGRPKEFVQDVVRLARPSSKASWPDGASEWPLLWGRVACGWLQVLKRIDWRDLSRQGRIIEWPRNMVHQLAFIIRSSPPCPALLSELLGFVPQFGYVPEQEDGMQMTEVHSILQWLKTFPDPPLDLMAVWENYLEALQAGRDVELELALRIATGEE
ncbi:hypothetical protein DFH06DRAFT_1099092, partial [Mycena polygramma]